jgi:hypothetical protein
MFVAVNGIVDIFGVLEVVPDHGGLCGDEGI